MEVTHLAVGVDSIHFAEMFWHGISV